MKPTLSGRNKDSSTAFQRLVNFLEKYGEVEEVKENLFTVDGRECILAAYNTQTYFVKKGYYWFSLAKTKYAAMLDWNIDHAWMVLICGDYGTFFIPFSQVKAIIERIPSNRKDGRWDLYVRLEGSHAYFGVTKITNLLDVADRLHSFEQIWASPAVEEIYVEEAIHIPDSLPEPDRKTGKVVRVVRDTTQSKLVKELYNYKCQICGWTTGSPRLKNYWYCEAHHVQPLAKKYGGPDHKSNIVALCPSHHCMMDLGVIAVEPANLKVISVDEKEADKDQKLTLHRDHGLNKKYLIFHLKRIYLSDYKTSEIHLSTTEQPF